MQNNRILYDKYRVTVTMHFYRSKCISALCAVVPLLESNIACLVFMRMYFMVYKMLNKILLQFTNKYLYEHKSELVSLFYGKFLSFLNSVLKFIFIKYFQYFSCAHVTGIYKKRHFIGILQKGKKWAYEKQLIFYICTRHFLVMLNVRQAKHEM